MIRSLAAALLCLVSSCAMTPAFAKPRQALAVVCNQLLPCDASDFFGWRVGPDPVRRGVAAISARAASTVLGGRPSGCPARFCGCGASLHLFGRIIPSLNLAANWLRFPRAVPAPNMVAARRGHVFVLKGHVAGSVWIVHDSNSGGRLTRLHARSIAGYAIVNPNGAS